MLGDNLNILMAKARLNCNELARQTGVPAGTIKRIKNNEGNPTIATLQPIAKHFSISISELIGDSPLLPHVTIGMKNIPVFTLQECAQFSSIDYEQHDRKIFTERQLSDKGYAIYQENSDLKYFPLHSYLIVEPNRKPVSSDYIIVAKIEQGIVSVKKYICDINTAYLKSLVDGIEVIPYTRDLTILGVVVQYKVEL